MFCDVIERMGQEGIGVIADEVDNFPVDHLCACMDLMGCSGGLWDSWGYHFY